MECVNIYAGEVGQYMDIEKYLIDQIRRCKRKMNLASLIDRGVLCAAAGGIPGICCELVSLFVPFYYAHLAAALCFGAGLLSGIGYAVYRRAGMRQAASRLDSFGLKERMLTAYENLGKEDAFARLQREDARAHYERIQSRIRIPLLPDRRHILALLVSAAAVAGLGLIPSPVREQAKLRHQVQEQAAEEKEELEKLLDALESVDMESLTEEQRAQLRELADTMELSREELAGADSWESLSAATGRLDYKYRQTAQSLMDLAGQMEHPDMAGLAGAEALARAAADQNSPSPYFSGTPSADSDDGGDDGPEGGNRSGDGEGSGQGDGNNSGNGNGQSGENSSGSGSGQSGEDGDGSGNGQNGENGSGNGNASGNGSGQDEGSGGDQSGSNGSGSGNGQGSGNGSGNGMGGGRGTGSSDTAHDYVSIPNAVGDDASLTGNKNGDQDSDYYRQQNGLAWEGDHVDYSSVIGEYTDSAYEGIANGKYPSGMEAVIRDYFENLNK